MNPASVDVLAKLATAGLVQTTNVAANWYGVRVLLPQNPRSAVAVVDTGGPGHQGYLQRSEGKPQIDTVQILVRSETETLAWQKAKAISDAILGWGRFSQGSSTYHGTAARGSIMPLRTEAERGLHVCSANFELTRQAE